MNIREKFENIKNRVMSLLNENQKLLIITMCVSLAVMLFIIYVIPLIVPKSFYGQLGVIFGEKIKSSDIARMCFQFVEVGVMSLYIPAFGLPVFIYLSYYIIALVDPGHRVYNSSGTHYHIESTVDNAHRYTLKESAEYYYYGWLLGAAFLGWGFVLVMIAILNDRDPLPFSMKTNIGKTLNVLIGLGGIVALFYIPHKISKYIIENDLKKKFKAFTLGILVAYILINLTGITESIVKWSMASPK